MVGKPAGQGGCSQDRSIFQAEVGAVAGPGMGHREAHPEEKRVGAGADPEEPPINRACTGRSIAQGRQLTGAQSKNVATPPTPPCLL